ncbi:hypothetical protein SV7mr_22950 [Stieleria bergensis]|uniref:Uncharacterized protein n=1 Tax=Stieleria bergensis TaxID=2528025 RepID=A0A517SUH8_9BACT|nr:hypothetical protein SV7mr_22950 [Planctomycetes bacterium SV_7m_r]
MSTNPHESISVDQCRLAFLFRDHEHCNPLHDERSSEGLVSGLNREWRLSLEMERENANEN